MTYSRVQTFKVGHCRHPEKMTKRDGTLSSVDFFALPSLIHHPVEGPILFDTGYDQAFLDATDRLPEKLYRLLTPVSFSPDQSLAAQLERQGIDCGDVRHVILSHFHGDHVAGIHHFPNARFHCARRGYEIAHKAGRISGTRQGILPGLLPADFSGRAQFFEDGRAITLPSDFAPFEHGVDLLGDESVIAVELPGHCPGHWGVAVRDDAHGWHMLVGDAAWSLDAIERNVPPPRIATAFLGNTRQSRATLGRLHQLRKRNPDLRLSPYHCPLRASEASDEGTV
ncbi:MAG: MBL fold metallo-hydrolase [Pseudomonadota bacterium]